MEEIKVGDLVMLKSGGPVMTVVSVKDEKCFCEWFNTETSIFVEKANFPMPALVKKPD